jgi:hypothetical protein
MGAMAKTRTQPVETLELEPDMTPADDDLVAIEEQILAAADATDQNVTWDIRIYKLDKSAGNAEEFMFSVLPSELDGLFERVRDSEGTGTYRMRAYRKVGSRNAVFKQKDFRIRAPMKPQAAPERPSELTAILAAMKEQSERNERLLREVLTARTQPEPQQRNPFDDLEKLTNIIKNLTPEQQQVRQQPQQDLTQVFVKGVEFAEKIVGDKGGGGETNLWDIAKAVISNLPAVAALANAQARHNAGQSPQQPPRQSQVKHNTGAPPANPQPAPPQQPQGNDHQAAILEMLQYLVTRAQRNSDPGFYADWLVENVDGEVITLMLSQADPVTMAIAIEPRVASYRLWFDTLIAELRQLVNMNRDHAAAGDDATRSDAETDVPDDDTGRGGRNGSHVANNGPIGKGW